MPLYWVGATLCLSNFFDLAELDEVQGFCSAGEGIWALMLWARNRRKASAWPAWWTLKDVDLQDFSTR
jgi:hypothetical protein